MAISADSLHNLLQKSSKAISVKETTLLHHFMQETFEHRVPHDNNLADSGMPSVDQMARNLLSHKVFGRDHEKNHLLSKLIRHPSDNRIHLSVIPILGVGGIGKTTLARLIYEDEAVKDHYELRSWMKVEGNELNLQQAARGILKSALGMSCSLDDQDELDEMVRDTLHSLKCLIVFDGVESMAMDSWQHMLQHWFDFLDLGSSVVITTSNKDVAAKLPLMELTQLSWDDSFLLWGYHLSLDHTGYMIKNATSTMVKNMNKNLSALCQSNPLALNLMVSLIRCDENLRSLLFAMDFSDDIEVPPSDVSVSVSLCIWALALQLRQCIAFCAVFPKGYAMNKEKIIAMWIANGLVEHNSSLEDIGNAYFHHLLCRSFFTDISCDEYGDVTEIRVPRLVHENILDLSRVLWKGKLGMIDSLDADASQLSLVFPFAETYHSKHLQSLILSPIIYLSDRSPDHSIIEFKDLRSLDLSCSGISNLSDDICSLKELKYLNLSYTPIKRLPDSITGLSHLQTLDLSWCSNLKVLPDGMRGFTHMTHLDLSQCDSLSGMPSGIGLLKSLTSMPLFVLGKGNDCAGLGELGPLNELRGTLEIRNLENATEISEARDAKMHEKKLLKLGLSWSRNAGDCFNVLEVLDPSVRLKDLDITGYNGSRFPQWISSINCLMKITITNCGCKKLPSMGQLSLLKELHLKGMYSLEHIGPEFYGDGQADEFFPSLEQLQLHDLPRLSEWSSETLQSTFQSLKTLTIEACPKLTTLPSLPTLSNLIIANSNEAILSSLTSFTSLSSLLINDMELGASNFQDLTWLDSLKKLTLCNIKDKLIVNISHVGTTFTALEHLIILHCYQLTDLCLFYFSSLQKLHILDCPNLFRVLVREEEDTPLVELVVEDCPEVFSEVCFSKFPSLRKLILKNCGGDLTLYYAGEYKRMQKLEYLFISRCSRIELEIQTFPSLISHIPCITMGDHKVNYKNMKDLMDVPIRASHETKADDLMHQRSHIKGGSRRSARCFGGFCNERRGSLGCFTIVRRTTCFETHVMTPV